MSNILSTEAVQADLAPIDIDLSVNEYYALPRRAYDYSKGDRRFFDHGEALAHAHIKAAKTGIRQIVRPDSDVLGASLFLVQEVGS